MRISPEEQEWVNTWDGSAFKVQKTLQRQRRRTLWDYRCVLVVWECLLRDGWSSRLFQIEGSSDQPDCHLYLDVLPRSLQYIEVPTVKCCPLLHWSGITPFHISMKQSYIILFQFLFMFYIITIGMPYWWRYNNNFKTIYTKLYKEIYSMRHHIYQIWKYVLYIPQHNIFKNIDFLLSFSLSW